MKFVLISPKNRTVYNFRGDLIKKIQSMGYEVIVTGPDKTDVEKIEALGVRFAEIPLNKTGTSIRGDIRYCNALTEFLKKEKPDVTLGYTVKPAIYGAIAAKRAGIDNVNSMITGGGYVFTAKTLKAKSIGALVRRLYKIGLGKADHVIFQNPDDKAEFCSHHLVNAEKCYVVNGSGINLSRFPKTPFPDSVSFFMLSRLLKSKGVCEYLEAARIVKRKFPSVNFYLLGKYEYEMQDAVEKDYVEGFIKDGIIERFEETTDVRPYYAKCSVYVLPSYREGTPRTVLEAMAMNRPVITTDTQGCRETVIDGENGFLVPVKNAEAVAEKMFWFIENQSMIQVMGDKSRAFAEKKFDVNLVNQAMTEYMNL